MRNIIITVVTFLIAQVAAVLGVVLWLNIDKTDWGFGGGVVMILLYLGISILVCSIGIVISYVTVTKDIKKVFISILLLLVLHILLAPVWGTIGSVLLRNNYRRTYDGNIVIMD